jgi:phospholipid/cholesterol/gamma-HCH transport system substrate-binding protein
LAHIEQTTANLETSSLQLNQLLRNDAPVITGNLKIATDNVVGLSENMKRLNLSESVDMLNVTLGNLNRTTTKLNATDNSLGLLLNDTLLYNSINQTVNNASNLIIDFKQHPKKYIHFSVF